MKVMRPLKLMLNTKRAGNWKRADWSEVEDPIQIIDIPRPVSYMLICISNSVKHSSIGMCSLERYIPPITMTKCQTFSAKNNHK